MQEKQPPSPLQMAKSEIPEHKHKKFEKAVERNFRRESGLSFSAQLKEKLRKQRLNQNKK